MDDFMGVSTRLIGALVMTHSDDDGLVLPPKVAPQQLVFLPIYRDENQKKQILDVCSQLKRTLLEYKFCGEQNIISFIDDRDIRGGEKLWSNVKKGIPIRCEVGPRDIENGVVMVGRRDQPAKKKSNKNGRICGLC